MVDAGELLTLTQAADKLKMVRSSVWTAIQSGKLESVKIGSRIFVVASSLENYTPRALPGVRDTPPPPRAPRRKAATSGSSGGAGLVEQTDRQPAGRPESSANRGAGLEGTERTEPGPTSASAAAVQAEEA